MQKRPGTVSLFKSFNSVVERLLLGQMSTELIRSAFPGEEKEAYASEADTAETTSQDVGTSWKQTLTPCDPGQRTSPFVQEMTQFLPQSTQDYTVGAGGLPYAVGKH